MRTAEGKLYLFVAIGRTSKFAFARLVRRANRRAAARLSSRACPRSPTRLTPSSPTTAPTSPNSRSAAKDIILARQRGELFRAHSFELACTDYSIDHRLTKPNHPWTNGQVERMNRTIRRPPFAPTTTSITISSDNTSAPLPPPLAAPCAASTATPPRSPLPCVHHAPSLPALG